MGSSGIVEVFVGLYVQMAGSNVAIVTSGDAALLINAGNPGIVDALQSLGVKRVERVIFTHHRRELADGLLGLTATFSPAISVPAAEAELFTQPAAYWADARSRWNLLCHHVPYHVTHIRPIPVSETLADGDSFTWHGWRIAILATPGYTDGALSLVLERDGKR